MAVYNSSGFGWYRHADLQGSSRLATTYAGGLHSATTFAPYGEPLFEAGTHDRSFTGQKQDIAAGGAGTDANGQYDFLAREYSPSQSRWWSPDPAGLAVVDPENPQSWNRYAYACDPTSSADLNGFATTCTINVNVQNKTNLSVMSVGAIVDRVNQIFATTQTSSGNTTQISWVDSGGDYTLSLIPGEADNLGLTFNGIFGLFAFSHVYPDSARENYTGYFLAGVGSVSAHELIHQITGIGDLIFNGQADLMNSNSADEAGLGYLTTADEQAQTPYGFSKLSQAEADALYRDCLKLKPPRTHPSGGGSAFGGGWRYSQIWSCSNEECGAVGGQFWYDDGGIIPPGLVSPFVF